MKSKEIKTLRRAYHEAAKDTSEDAAYEKRIVAIRTEIAQTAIFYLYPAVIGGLIFTFADNDRLEKSPLTSMLWGALFWYICLLSRRPVRDSVVAFRIFDPIASVSVIIAFVECGARVFALHVYPFQNGVGALAFALGWMSIEALAGLLSLYAATTIMKRKDERAVEALRRMQAMKMPSPLAVSPWNSLVERFGEGTLAAGSALTIGFHPWAFFAAFATQSAVMFFTRTKLSGSSGSFALAGAGLFVLLIGLSLNLLY
ncbi:hypothetical protein DFJ73DRAFT_844450 [Zopfochytrium polystomum]|nr:hypothetical protein DFJ73DRAFT_844450 [Zopfochytrium polystomum]